MRVNEYARNVSHCARLPRACAALWLNLLVLRRAARRQLLRARRRRIGQQLQLELEHWDRNARVCELARAQRLRCTSAN
jgi:hypothetical protein